MLTSDDLTQVSFHMREERARRPLHLLEYGSRKGAEYYRGMTKMSLMLLPVPKEKPYHIKGGIIIRDGEGWEWRKAVGMERLTLGHSRLELERVNLMR